MKSEGHYKIVKLAHTVQQAETHDLGLFQHIQCDPNEFWELSAVCLGKCEHGKLGSRPKQPDWDPPGGVVHVGWQTHADAAHLWYEREQILIFPYYRRISHFWTKPALVASCTVHYGLKDDFVDRQLAVAVTQTWIKGWPGTVKKFVAFLIFGQMTVEPDS